MELLSQFALLCVGFIMLGKGADLFVEGASGIAKRFGISEMIIGLTIVAMGTSAPEAAVSIAAAFSGSAGISIGNVIGSNLINILVILGVTALIKALPVQRATLIIDMPFVLAMTVLFYFLGKDGTITFMDGSTFWLCFLGYMFYLYRSAMKIIESRKLLVQEESIQDQPEKEQPEAEPQFALVKQILFTIAGAVVIVYGSEITVDAAVVIAKFLGWSDRVIGLTIVALGTSLPELFTSVTAAIKGNVDIAIGNIVGSNIFNILFVIGTSALIIPIPFDKAFMFDMYWCIAAATMLVLLILPTARLERWGGGIMLASYCAYLYMML